MIRGKWAAAGAAVALLGCGGAVIAQEGADAPDAASAPAASAAVPVEVFAALPAIEGPKLSPQGDRIAAKMAVGGRQLLVVRDLAADAKPATLAANGDNDILWWRWVGNDWLVIGIGGQQTIYGDEVYITRTLAVSADMKKQVRIGWEQAGLRADDLLWTARDGTPRILLAMQTGIEKLEDYYPSVFEANLATGRTKRIVVGQTNVYDWYADGAGVVRAGWRHNDQTRERALLYRATPADPFRPIAVRRKGNDDGIAAPAIFRADGSAITIADDDKGFSTVYEMSLPDLTLGKKIFASPGYDVGGVISNLPDNDIDAVAVTDRTGHTEWLNPDMKQIQSVIDAAVAPRRASIISWSDDRQRLLVWVGSASQAGAYYFFQTASGRMQRIAYQSAALKTRTLSPVSTIRYQARDGTPIEAVVTLPRGRTAKDLPLIVMPHGGPFARDVEEWDWWSQYLAEIGYAVIQPNYRGSSGYGTAFAKLGEGQWGLKMQDDLDDAAAYMVKQGIADARRTCMVGASYGGYAAMRAAQRGGGYRCAISYAGVSDLQEMRRYDSQFLFAKTRSDWLTRQAPDFRAVSPRYGAATFSVPILLVHGKVDKRVPVKQSRLMVAALQAAHKPYEYLEQPLADHHFTRSEDRLEFLKRMKVFLDRYNPA